MLSVVPESLVKMMFDLLRETGIEVHGCYIRMGTAFRQPAQSCSHEQNVSVYSAQGKSIVEFHDAVCSLDSNTIETEEPVECFNLSLAIKERE